MAWLTTALRRTLWLVLIGAVGSIAWSWWNERNGPPDPAEPPTWPPLEPDAESRTSTSTAAPAPAAARAPAPAGTATASFVNALVDAPEARSRADGGTWIAPDEHGACPVSHPIKANDNSGIFHVPGGRFYDRTTPERCYSSAEAATADGYRQAKA